ncbi:hypothetical protein MNBD_GAMMA12-986 [hydrothermal vent metagenome]|uniref:SWIM-type domain-containing protein n=1 Tax=hydrothermal vent metagenome TaxID=652676 RepID=A0A3B0YDY9_9ZZZZ
MTQTVVNKKAIDSESGLSDSMPVTLNYNNASQMSVTDESAQLQLACDKHRANIELEAEICDPLLFRDCMRGLFDVVSSDYRYVPKDRAAYNAYRQLKQSIRSKSAWTAQQAYYEWLSKNDPLAYLILDPIVTNHPDKVLFEVFSKDEGSYATFSLDHDVLQHKTESSYGSSNIDFSESLLKSFDAFRSYRHNSLKIDSQQLEVTIEDHDAVLEKKLNVPESWLRAFLQVQTAAAMPCKEFKMAAIDLYNILRFLRMHADKKGKRRGMRIELIPNEYPRIILEPWEEVFECSAEKYTGKTANITRVWGRRRLMMLQNILPYADEIDVNLLGNALPSFWTLKSKSMSFCLSLTGFTASNWSQALNFDLMLPRSNDSKIVDSLQKAMQKNWFMDFEQLAKVLVKKGCLSSAEELQSALQAACQQGWLMFDMAKRVYRYRPLVNVELDQKTLEFRGRQDRQAHDLIKRKDSVTLDKENEVYGVGVELTGTVVVDEDKRKYQPFMLISEEGSVNKVTCTCPFYRKHKLTEGPCAHLIALRIHYSLEQKRRMNDESTKNIIKVQTRTLSKRNDEQEMIYYITLDQHRIKKRWGLNGEKLRLQNIQFNSSDEARNNYFQQIDQLINKGYLDLSAGL